MLPQYPSRRRAKAEQVTTKPALLGALAGFILASFVFMLLGVGQPAAPPPSLAELAAAGALDPRSPLYDHCDTGFDVAASGWRVVSGGMVRSGSTWQTRALAELLRQGGAASFEDGFYRHRAPMHEGEPREALLAADRALVKTHAYWPEVDNGATLVFATHTSLADAVRSGVGQWWGKPTTAFLAPYVDHMVEDVGNWTASACSCCVLSFTDIQAQPELAVVRMARALGLERVDIPRVLARSANAGPRRTSSSQGADRLDAAGIDIEAFVRERQGEWMRHHGYAESTVRV